MQFLVKAVCVMWCVSASGQALSDGPVGGQQALAMTKMRESVARQVASVGRQRNAPAEDDFFSVPWFTPNPVQVKEQTGATARVDDQNECAKLSPDHASALIREAAEEQGIAPRILHAVIQQESGYRPCAISPKGAMGLMQLMPATAYDFGVVDPLNPRENIAAGSKFLQQLLQRYGGNLLKALSAYNAGPARVDRIGGIPNIEETKQYVTSIMRKLRVQSIEPIE